MKKVLVAGAALLLAGGIASTASAAAVEPGVKITGDARARLIYKDSYDFGQKDDGDQTNLDHRIRFNVAGTAAGRRAGNTNESRPPCMARGAALRVQSHK